MQDIPADVLALAEEGAPQFVQDVRTAARTGSMEGVAPALRLALETFQDDPMLLYACLWYAHACGVDVMFVAVRSLPREQLPERIP